MMKPGNYANTGLMALALSLALALPASAAVQTTVLEVAMSCPSSDPQVVEIALKRMKGVSEVKVIFDAQSVTVVYDDEIAKVTDMIDNLVDLGLEAMEVDDMPEQADGTGQ